MAEIDDETEVPPGPPTPPVRPTRAVVRGTTLAGEPAAVVMQLLDGDPPTVSVLASGAVVLDDRGAARALDHLIGLYLQVLDGSTGCP